MRVFFWERVSTPKLPQQNAFWVELEPILHLRTSMWGRAKGNFQWKCVFPMEIPAESQGSPSGNQVVEMDPSRAGNVYKAQMGGRRGGCSQQRPARMGSVVHLPASKGRGCPGEPGSVTPLPLPSHMCLFPLPRAAPSLVSFPTRRGGGVRVWGAV